MPSSAPTKLAAMLSTWTDGSDGPLKTDEGTVWLTDNQRGRLSKIGARHATRLRETQPVVADASAANEVVLR